MDTATILEQLLTLNTDLKQNKPAAREQMLATAQALVTSLQTPSELISSIGWAEPAQFACLRTAVDLKILEILEQVGNDGATSAELAKATGADEALIARIMKHLAATNLILELSQDRYSHTRLSSQLTEPKYRDGIIYCYDVAGPSFRSMPSYFAQTGYKQPLNPTSGPFQHSHNTTSHFFPWLTQNPPYLAAFTSYMSGYRAGKPTWFSPDFYPVQRNLIDGCKPPSPSSGTPVPFLVDVGGGAGHDLAALSAHFPTLPNLILQDTPEVIANLAPLTPSIHAMAHDFFTPQPVHGARAYFLHSVLHDWDDDACVKILENLKPALVPGYSRVLVHELIVPDTRAGWSVTAMDWLMMALGSVRERTERDFRRLFREAGLEVTGWWVYEQGTEGVIEACLPEE